MRAKYHGEKREWIGKGKEWEVGEPSTGRALKNKVSLSLYNKWGREDHGSIDDLGEA